MVKIFIDDKQLEVKEGMTVFQAAKEAGIDIPHLCYHPAFIPEGSCRMCLVEIEGAPKLELACSTQIREGMKIFTKTDQVIEARKGVLEFLLAEHPPDCPICDKAGDCKLQDYYEEFGLFESQFQEAKEKKQKKIEIGSNLILDQERCVLCTRCVRFLRDIAGTQELGVFERGIHSEINIYDNKKIKSDYAGNLADLCPVGAITDKDFRFQTRSWFLNSGDSICPLCARGCNIQIESHKGFSRFPVPKKVFRIKARKNDLVNKTWICDHGRYDYAYLNENRLDHIQTRNNAEKLSYKDIISLISKKLVRFKETGSLSKAVVGIHSSLSNEELYLAKKIFQEDLGMERIYFIDPKSAKSDGFLLTAERSANKRGAKELGFNIGKLNLEEISSKTRFLILFGTFLWDRFPSEDIQKALSSIRTKILFSAHDNDFNSMFDIVCPVPLTAEKSGSLTNVDGFIQPFSPAMDAPGESLPEWELLLKLGIKMNINYPLYHQFAGSDDVFKTLKKEVPFFGKE